MAQEEAQVRCQAIPCGICGLQSDSWTCFSPRFSVLCYQYHSSIDPYSFVRISPTLQRLTASLNITKTKYSQLLKCLVLNLIHISHSAHRPGNVGTSVISVTVTDALRTYVTAR